MVCGCPKNVLDYIYENVCDCVSIVIDYSLLSDAFPNDHKGLIQLYIKEVRYSLQKTVTCESYYAIAS